MIIGDTHRREAAPYRLPNVAFLPDDVVRNPQCVEHRNHGLTMRYGIGQPIPHISAVGYDHETRKPDADSQARQLVTSQS